jgi:ribonuclease HI
MELTAAIMAMSFPEKPSRIALYTDSQYLQHAFTDNWLVAWKKRGWKKKNGEPVLNQDLWQKLDALYQKHLVQLYWVRGHVGVRQNERCDELARNKAFEYAPR